MSQTYRYTRRSMLRSLLAASATPLFAARAHAAGAEPGGASVVSFSGPNIVLCQSGDSLVLVDSGPAGDGAALRQELIARNAVNLRLFNTHWHDEQVGGNELLGSMGATLIAHEKTKLHLGTDTWQPELQSWKPALPAAAIPAQTFYTRGSLALADETVDYGHLQSAHTDGDIYVFFRNANVLAVGDVVSPARDPAHDWFGGGWIGGRVDALDLILALADAATQIVPAFGPVVTKADVQAERELMQFLYDRLVDQIRMGFTPQDSLDSGLMSGLPRTFTDPYRFLYDAHKGLWAHHNKLAPNIV